MDQTLPQIETHIEQARHRLGRHLHELERKVEKATDWREYVRARPAIVLGAAVAGGLLIGSMGRRRPTSSGRSTSSDRPTLGPQAAEVWTNIRTALVGVAAARVTGYMATLIPGFDEHLQKAEERVGGRRPLQ